MNISKTIFILFTIIATAGCKRASSPVVGNWQLQQFGDPVDGTIVNVVEKLTADGKMRMRFSRGSQLVADRNRPMMFRFQAGIGSPDGSNDETVSGTWSLTGDHLALECKSEYGMTKGFVDRTLVAHTKDSLTLRTPDGTTEQYTRIGDAE